MRVAGFRGAGIRICTRFWPQYARSRDVLLHENCASDVNVLLITLVRFSAYNSTDQASFVTPQDTS